MSRTRPPSLLILLLSALPAVALHAQTPHANDPQACVGIASDSLRLACYDRALHRDQVHGEAAQEVQQQDTPTANVPTPSVENDHPEAAPAPDNNSILQRLFGTERSAFTSRTDTDEDHSPRVSLLDSRWELNPDSKLGTFGIRGYKPVYLLPAFYMTSVNTTPHSPSPDHSVDTPIALDHTETKFQISLKTKVWQGVFGQRGDLWLGYTQASHWQVYNSLISRPFRETNYEPEAMLVFNTHYKVLGWDGRLLGIGINHQSNGRSNPLSRSWNRVIADFGFERGPWTVMIRPWWRVHEQRSKDDNPDISDYMGRADVQIVREWGANELTLMARHSLRTGNRSHGALRFTWAFPIHDNLRGYVQVFNGYGESLIDYNHRATYVGLGVSLLGWY
ncbi:phospholipase A [Oleiagrimonas soli]|uniref:Phospholipase A1 n=1 Tax=Oleiagrimonas soli TaxID=1543381 RepID=A0A099CZ61_9GAMM|nr:phospholipase A [Oleiagrimonas soli]KGI78325.1 phospholipase [Oleiagrimonas soli]MBB6183180.1 phospholipase A1 [Oleiagrimonas soli]